MPVTEGRTPVWSIRPFSPRDRAALVRMYTYFEPKRAAQGLPPDVPHRLEAWLDDVLGRGTHLLAHVGGDVVGHVMLMPLDESTVELANFVDLHWRNRGLGTALNLAAIEAARAGPWQRIWLCVDPSNRAAIRSYSRSGFKPVPGRSWAPEIEMFFDIGPAVAATADGSGAAHHGSGRGA